MATMRGSSVQGDCRANRMLECGLLPCVGMGLLAVCFAATAQDSPSAIPMRELLTVAGISDVQWASLQDGQPTSTLDRQLLMQVLFRLPQVRLQSVAAWSVPPDWPKITDAADTCRGSMYRITGRASRLTPVSASAEEAQQWGLDKYYRLEVFIDGPVPRVVVFVKTVPHSWQPVAERDGILDTSIVTDAVFLKLGPRNDESTVPIFVAASVAWHPTHAARELGVTESHVLLAGLGMDLRLLDDVRDRQGLMAEEREGFYQLLAAVGRTQRVDLARRVNGDVELRLLLDRQEYPQQRGELIALSGNVRRAVRIAVEAPDIRTRLGLDHYYELNIFVDESVQLKRHADDKEPMYYARYPVVCCVRKLPPGMPEGDDINEAVRVVGFFFKLYAYKTQFTSSQPGQPRQMSPLLVSPEPYWFARQSPPTSRWELAWGLGFVLVVATTWLIVWRFHRQDQRFRQSTLQRKFKLSEDASWDRIAPGGDSNDAGGRESTEC